MILKYLFILHFYCRICRCNSGIISAICFLWRNMIRLSLDVQNSFIPIVRRCVRSFSTTRSFNDTRTARERKRQLRESTPFQMQGSGKHSERKQRVFVFGYKATGALGLGWTRQDESPYPMKIVSKPYNLTFFAKQQFKLLDVACGFGYTVFACKRSSMNSSENIFSINILSNISSTEMYRTLGTLWLWIEH